PFPYQSLTLPKVIVTVCPRFIDSLQLSLSFCTRTEIYNIINPTTPIRVGEFGAGDLDFPNGLAIFTVFGYNYQ
ncbi:hypothetical protein CN923_26575, partial [Bacillus cereus]